MKIIVLFFATYLSLNLTIVNAQLLINVSEYRIGFGGKFLSYSTPNDNPVSNTATATETIVTTNPITGQKTTINRPVNEAKPINNSKINTNNTSLNNAVKIPLNYISPGADMLVMELNNYASRSQFERDKQIWKISYIYTGTFNRYYLIMNKASGKYLTMSVKDGKDVVQLEPFITGNSQSQHWRFNNLEELSENNLPFYGKTKEVSIVQGEEVSGQQIARPAIYRKDHTTNQLEIGLIGSNYLFTGHNNSLNTIDPKVKFYITPNKGTKINLTNLDYPNMPICPTKLVRGDRDFNGLNVGEAVVEIFGDGSLKRNPVTNFEIKLSITDDFKGIWADIKLNVVEEKSDRSETEGSWRFKVYTAPAGKLLDQIISEKEYNRSLLGNFQRNTARNKVMYNCEFMEYFIVIGDTMGDDISDDGNCNDDTRIEQIIFRPLFVTFK
ncbi:MAG: hypothetical protein EOO47_11720 [Flavobacterium sp.]|nr:MAG: hypothetical protein EOO47_11720 [Flavobacterium sp.]